MNINEIIRRKRKTLGFTQKQVADKLYIQHNTYCQYETGDRKIEAEMLIKIANILHINLLSFQSEPIKNEYSYKIATHDHLTGVLNRRTFLENIQRKIDASDNFSFYLLDINHFKQFNDVYGHDAGDNILKEIGRILIASDVPTNQTARLGGELFGLFVDNLENCKSNVFASLFETLNHFHPKIHFSYGMSVYIKGDSFYNLYQRADASLLEFKNKGTI